MLRAAGFLMLAIPAAVAGQVGPLPTVEVHDKGAVRVLDERTRSQIRILAIRLLESSNFNSEAHRELLKATPKTTHTAYRKTVAGRYLLISFDQPRSINTIGGEVDTLEVVVGLIPSSLFTIDREGRVVAHEKYSGADTVTLLRRVDAALAEP
jgi:hypothetical protein